jgi:predicted  nucleic acid-binding Zn-ribbon protein
VFTEERFDNLDNKLDILIEQIGRLTEGIAEFRLSTQESLTEFRLTMQQSMTEFRADLAEIKETTRVQAETAARLARIVETLIERQS